MSAYYGNHIFIVWSTLPEATTLTNFSGSATLASASMPFGLTSLPPLEGCRPHARVATKCPCASTVFTHRAVASSQTRMVLSSEADNKNLPDGWNTSARIQLLCPGYISTKSFSERI
jgi:hypothetical protein